MIGLYCLAPRSNQPTLTSANAPMAVTDAPMNFFLIRKVRNGLEGVFDGVENQHENAPGAAVHRS